MWRFWFFGGNTFNFLTFLTLNLKRGTNLNNEIFVASMDVWQSYFTHSCCQIHFTLFRRKFTFVAIYAFFAGKIVLAEN